MEKTSLSHVTRKKTAKICNGLYDIISNASKREKKTQF
jgi:hypothetical protein